MWPRTGFHCQLSSIFLLTWVPIRMGLSMLFLMNNLLQQCLVILIFEETRNGDGKGGDGRHVKLIDNGNGGIDMQKGQSYSAGNYSAFDVMKTTLQMHLNLDDSTFSSSRAVSYGIDQSS
jgi:hypothetical protein